MRKKSSGSSRNSSSSTCTQAKPDGSAFPLVVFVLASQQEAQAVEQLRQERERYNLILAREQRDRGDRRAAASTKPSVLPKNYLGRPPSPEELHQKRQARKSSNGSEADVSSGSLPLRPSIHSVAKKSTLAMASAFGKQASRPKATDSPVIDRYYQQQQGAGRPRASTLNAIDNWAQPVPPAAQTRQQQLKAYDSPSAYSQVSQSTYATDLSVNASRGREKLIKAVRQ